MRQTALLSLTIYTLGLVLAIYLIVNLFAVEILKVFAGIMSDMPTQLVQVDCPKAASALDPITAVVTFTNPLDVAQNYNLSPTYSGNYLAGYDRQINVSPHETVTISLPLQPSTGEERPSWTIYAFSEHDNPEAGYSDWRSSFVGVCGVWHVGLFGLNGMPLVLMLSVVGVAAMFIGVGWWRWVRRHRWIAVIGGVMSLIMVFLLLRLLL